MASLGIDERHLNKSIAQLQPHFRSLHRKFGFHICGEGGEYETFTLDCPLYKRRLEPTGVRVTRHAEDASVAVLQFDGLARHQKPVVAEAEAAMAAAVSAAVAAGKAAAAGDEEAEAGAAGAAEKEEAAAEAAAAAEATREGIAWWLSDGITGGTATKAATAATAAVAAAAPEAAAGHVWLEAVPGGLMHVVARGEAKPREEPSSSPAAQEAATAEAAASAAAAQLTAALERVVKALGARGLTLGNVLFVRLYVAQMAHYATVNKAYSAFFAGHAPAARAAVQLPLGGGGGDGGGSGGGAGGGDDALVVLEAVACGAPKRLLHVQSISEWAPRMIGPYCQMTEAHGVALVAGNLGLDPATMTLVEGGTAAQAEKALDNCAAVLGGLSFTARSTLQLCAYVTAEADAAAVRRAVRGWLHRHKVGRGGGKGDGEAASKAEFKGEAGGGDAAWEDAAAVVVVQVGALPMGALVEIQIEAATAEAPPLARRSYRVRRGNLDVACRLTVGGGEVPPARLCWSHRQRHGRGAPTAPHRLHRHRHRLGIGSGGRGGGARTGRGGARGGCAACAGGARDAAVPRGRNGGEGGGVERACGGTKRSEGAAAGTADAAAAACISRHARSRLLRGWGGADGRRRPPAAPRDSRCHGRRLRQRGRGRRRRRGCERLHRRRSAG